MPTCKRGEGFARLAASQINCKRALQQSRNLRERNTLEYFPANCATRARTASKNDVVALDGFTRHIDFDALQPDVADIMLRARVRTAGQVDIDRLVQFHTLVQVTRERHGLALRISSRKFA